MMKAVVVREFGGADVLRVESVASPQRSEGQVLVRLRAAGVNPVDTYVRSGVYARRPALPYTPGADGAGTVEAVDQASAGFAPGDRVYITGTVAGPFGSYAELAVCHPGDVHPLPSSVTFEQGAAIGVPYGTAYRALFQRGTALPGETVLVHGASGGVGTAAVQLARAAGLRVFGSAGSQAGLDLLAGLAADRVFDHREPAYTDRILEATGGRGVDIILEMLANVNLDRDLDLLARFGRVVVIGNRGTLAIDPRKAMSRDADIRGMLLFNTPPGDLARIHAALAAGLAHGTIQPVVGPVFPLDDAPLAHEAVMSPGARGKVVLRMEGSPEVLKS